MPRGILNAAEISAWLRSENSASSITSRSAVGSLASGYVWQGMGGEMTFWVAGGVAMLGALAAARLIDRQHDY